MKLLNLFIISFTMNILNLLSTCLQFLEELLLGLPLFLAPDYFFNPNNGFLVLRPFDHTSLESDHLDVATQISLAGAGATMLTFFLARFLLAKTNAERVMVSRMKLLSDLLIFPVVIHSAFFDKSGYFHRQLFNIFAQFKILCIALNLNALKQHIDQQRTTNGYSMAARLILLYCVPMAVLLYAAPNLFAPGKLLEYYKKTPLEKNTFDSLEKFAIRFEGSQLVGMVPLFWDATKMTSFAYKTAVALMTLYLFVFMRGIIDRSGYCDLEVWKGNFVLHLLIISLSWNLSKAKLEYFTRFMDVPHIETKNPTHNDVPNLQPEPEHNKWSKTKELF